MSIDDNAHTQHGGDTELNKLITGLGVFRGPVTEGKDYKRTLETQSAFALGLCILITILLVWWLLASKVPGLVVPCILMALVTFVVLIFTIDVFRKPIQQRGSIAVEGVWITADSVVFGKHEMGLQNPWIISQLYEQDHVDLTSVASAKLDGTTRVDASSAEIYIQLVNSERQGNDYRIAKVAMHNIVNSDGSFPTCNLMLDGGNRFIVVGSIAYLCARTTLADQVRKIADGLAAVDPKHNIRCNLLITPRSDAAGNILGGQAYLYGAVGGAIGAVVKMATDKRRAGHVREALQARTFVNKETSDLLLNLLDTQEWKIEVRPYRTNELGLGGSNW